MSQASPEGFRPPSHPPARGRHQYLLDDYYLTGHGGVPLNLVLRATVQCLARWVDNYEIYQVGIPSSRQAGTLPHNPDERHIIIEDILDRLNRMPGDLNAAAVNLFQSGTAILAQPEGFPGHLELTNDQFRQLQQEFERSGLPQDIYYDVREQRIIIEPVEFYGGVFLAYRRYSPQWWARRDTNAIESLRIPNEEERWDRFAHACDVFATAITLRRMEMREPGRQPDEAELDRLLQLQRQVAAAWARAKELEASAPRDEVNTD